MALQKLVEQFNNDFVTAGADNRDVVVAMYANVYATAEADIPAGFVDWWVAQLESGAVTQETLVETSLNYAAAGSLAAGDLVTEANAANAAIAEGAETLEDVKAAVEAAQENPTDPGVPGEEMTLTAGTDVVTGTEDNDTFYANAHTNDLGIVVNELGIGDVVNGGAGRDTIVASLVEDNRWNDDLSPRPTTTNVEEVYIEALETVTLDATRMENVEEFWSNFSRGDFTVNNVNLQGSNLNITKDVTFGLKDTQFGTDFTASFDSQSLLRAPEQASNSQLLIRIADVSTETPATPLANVSVTLGFELADEEFVLTDVVSTDGSYQGLVEAIEAALAEQGLGSLDVELSTPYEQVTVAGNTVNLPFTAQEILITDPNGQEFGAVDFTQAAIESVEGGFLVAGNADPVDPSVSSNLIETNLVLDNAGRGSTAGDVAIGGESNSNIGVERFNVTVDRSSKIASLKQTAENSAALKEIYIDSMGADGSLTIGEVDADLNVINATEFEGAALNIGSVSDLVSFNSAGSATNVTLVADYDGNGRASDAQAFTINTGSGNDNITADLTGTSDSTSTQASLTINSTGGNNTVKLSSDTTEVNKSTVVLGNGDDTVTGGATHMTANTGAGNDVVYTDNTGTKAVHAIDPTLNNEALLLHGRTVTVTLTGFDDSVAAAVGVATDSGFESSAIEISGDSGNNYLTSQDDYNNAIVKAINEDAVLSKLAKASIESTGNIKVEFLFDGALGAGAVNVDIGGNDTWADISSTTVQNAIESGYRTELQDSTVDVTAAYAAVDALNKEASTVTTAGVDSATASDNIINAGAGNDVIVLGTDVTGGAAADVSNDTIVFTGYNQGTVTIVNFVNGVDTAGGDLLDFSDYLTNQESASGSTESRTDVAVTTAGTGAFIENSVVVTDFATLNAGTALGAGVTFDSMTTTQIEAAMNANFSEAAVAATNLVGTERKAVMMVENAAGNDGEYKMYEVTFDADNTNAEDFSVQLIGTADFGDSLGAITAANTLVGA